MKQGPVINHYMDSHALRCSSTDAEQQLSMRADKHVFIRGAAFGVLASSADGAVLVGVLALVGRVVRVVQRVRRVRRTLAILCLW